MAEIFGAVASGAGLASLAIQFVDSAQKLKALYNASKDAPTTVAELCFELETMSLSLRQLDSHRSASITGDELLGRCYVTCIRMVGKIGDAVTKIERLIQRRRMVGRLYMAFKEPEIRELLEELERSKSSMSFAYMSYCHSWSLREAAKHNALLTAQSNAISSQITQLHDLENAVQAGNSMILDRLTVPTSVKSPQDTLASTPQRLQVEVRQTKKSHSHRKFRIALPRSFVDCVWEFGMRGTGNGWEFQLHPVNMRARESFVFKVVTSGRVPAVRALLESGSLSIHDRAMASDHGVPVPCESLLDLAAGHGHIELCRFLLDQYSYFCEDATMQSALHRFVNRSRIRSEIDFKSARQEADDLYCLFIDRHNMVITTTEGEHQNIDSLENIESNWLLTENSLRQILDSQFASTHSLAFELKFTVAMGSTGWPADAFLKFLHPCDSSKLVTKTDRYANTVLHWAAKHFAYWVCAWAHRDQCPDGTMIESYAVLLKKLIIMGADVHAVNAQYETPLMTVLHESMTVVDWPACALAIKRWGEILGEAEIILSHYIQIENNLLRSLAGKFRASKGAARYMRLPHDTQLLVLEHSILTAKIRFCRPIKIWERWTSPGAWNTEPRLPTRSSLRPPQSVESSLFWHEVDTITIYSSSYLIQGTSRLDTPFYSSEDFENNWRTLFIGTQDDHGLVARTVLRDRSRSEAKIPVLRDRASSMPPEPTLKVYNGLPTLLSSTTEVDLGYDHWIPVAYRCPIEPMRSWRLGTRNELECWIEDFPRYLPNFDSRRAEERLYAKDDWEVQLLREQGDTDTVKRFGYRFCRDVRDLIEQELATTRSIMELN